MGQSLFYMLCVKEDLETPLCLSSNRAVSVRGVHGLPPLTRHDIIFADLIVFSLPQHEYTLLGNVGYKYSLWSAVLLTKDIKVIPVRNHPRKESKQ